MSYIVVNPAIMAQATDVEGTVTSPGIAIEGYASGEVVQMLAGVGT